MTVFLYNEQLFSISLTFPRMLNRVIDVRHKGNRGLYANVKMPYWPEKRLSKQVREVGRIVAFLIYILRDYGIIT